YNASNLSEEKEQSLNNSDNESIQSLNQSIIEENLEEQQSHPTIQISLMENLSQEIIQGSFKEFTISVQNTGDTPVSSCRLRVEDPEWINLSNEAKDLAPGESNSFKFLVSVPNKAPIGEKTFKLFVECTEISESKQFIVNVLEKKLDLIVNDVQRVTPTRVRIIYTLKELSGESQFVQLKFSLFSSDNKEISNTTQNKSINPNEEKEFVASMRINKSINGTLNLVTFYNSQIFSSSLSEPINLGTPIGGFVILGERFGASKFVIIPIIIVVFAATFFILKKIRKLHNIKKQKTK
ncbi:MAG: NEW3 domain-containing protein, partial [Candidatus Pacearchaeota archaeon]